jgi:hypothetical protein
MTTTNNNGNGEKQVRWLQYLNTFILTMILGFAMMIFYTVNGVKKDNQTLREEYVRINTNQIAVMKSVDEMDVRVKALELSYMTELKEWVRLNFEPKK